MKEKQRDLIYSDPYSTSVGVSEINWRYELEKILHDYDSVEMYIICLKSPYQFENLDGFFESVQDNKSLLHAARFFNSCAVGQLNYRLHNPRDPQLETLGYRFYNNLCLGEISKALEILDLIEEKAFSLLNNLNDDDQ